MSNFEIDQNFIQLDEFLNTLGVKLPNREKLIELADNLAYFKAGENEIINANYERGVLLYALIQKFRPKNVLEFGTAKGFGTLCMAWAMEDQKIDGTIYTIDYIGQDTQIENISKNENGFHIENTTRKHLWERTAPKEWIEKIKVLVGHSGDIISKTNLPKIQMFFIDAAHFYWGVKHDYYQSLKLADSKYTILFDDYIERSEYGVKKLIDDEVSKYFDVIKIKTDHSNYFINTGITASEYGMCLISSDKMKKDLNANKLEMNDFIKKYQQYEKRMKLRRYLEKKIPMLKNRKFGFSKIT